MKIVLDTNVFISGIFFHGPPAQILYECFRSHQKFYGVPENELGEKIRSRIISCFWTGSTPGSVTRIFNLLHRKRF